MKQFKLSYKIAIGTCVIGSLILVFFLNDDLNTSDLLATSIGLAALIIAFVAVMISDKEQPNIKFDLEIWPKDAEMEGNVYRIMFKGINTSKYPISDAIITIKLPDGVFEISNDSGQEQFRKIRYGQTDIFNTDFFRYFPNEDKNNSISFEALIDFNPKRWHNKDRKLYFTVSGQNLKAKTIDIPQYSFQKILDSNRKNPAKFS